MGRVGVTVVFRLGASDRGGLEQLAQVAGQVVEGVHDALAVQHDPRHEGQAGREGGRPGKGRMLSIARSTVTIHLSKRTQYFPQLHTRFKIMFHSIYKVGARRKYTKG